MKSESLRHFTRCLVSRVIAHKLATITTTKADYSAIKAIYLYFSQVLEKFSIFFI